MRRQSYLFHSYLFLSVSLFSLSTLIADSGDESDDFPVNPVALEEQALPTPSAELPVLPLEAPKESFKDLPPVRKVSLQEKAISPFTAKIKGKKVRMRAGADLESRVVRELSRNDLVVVVGEKGDFYAVEPPENMKAYVFRSFVLDGVIEGNRVNVRLEPSIDAPIISHLNAGDRVDGVVSAANTKWYEISPPADTHLYIAKEYLESVGGPEVKRQMDRKRQTGEQLLAAAELLMETELKKPFPEMDIGRIRNNYETVIAECSECTDLCQKAKDKLVELNETYLQEKVSFLELKTAKESSHDVSLARQTVSATDRMKLWAPVEESLYLSWASTHGDLSLSEFYEEEKLNGTTISGIVEAYTAPMRKKPGDFLLRGKELPQAYLYSTHVNLQDYVGKKVTLLVAPRDNNNFAFPAYYVLKAE